MRLITLLILAMSSAVSISGMPISAISDIQTQKRDGSTEFDTDLCLLKREARKRGDVAGLGIDNCDI
ncbi:hypothetical protein F4809DRAFT_636473 [Biscogniauxia mediterranea]|nr:hypothetical protein F4809DRAFT_636473 [Biscogniauxia mediterranea]